MQGSDKHLGWRKLACNVSTSDIHCFGLRPDRLAVELCKMVHVSRVSQKAYSRSSSVRANT